MGNYGQLSIELSDCEKSLVEKKSDDFVQPTLPGIENVVSSVVTIEPVEPMKLVFAGKCGDIVRHIANIDHREYLKDAKSQPVWVINTIWELHNSLYERELTITDAEIYVEAFRISDRMRG